MLRIMVSVRLTISSVGRHTMNGSEGVNLSIFTAGAGQGEKLHALSIDTRRDRDVVERWAGYCWPCIDR